MFNSQILVESSNVRSDIKDCSILQSNLHLSTGWVSHSNHGPIAKHSPNEEEEEEGGGGGEGGSVSNCHMT